MDGLIRFVKKEPVLSISAVLAAASMLVVPPSAAYGEYIDVRVLCLLFCLMAVVAGVQECGLFTVLAQNLLSGRKPFRVISILLVLLPFFSSMLVTNDVALITFVPFAILVLELAGRRDALIRVVVLQTVAANLGSMATPVGNPQNLFLYAAYELSAGQFFGTVVPPALLSLAALTLAACFLLPRQLPELRLEEETLQGPKKLAVYGGLFLLCLLTVFRVTPYGITTVLVAGALLVLDRQLLKSVDYALLLTFVCFFVLSGNLGRVEPVRRFLQSLLQKNALLTAAGASQIISNVPAAVLLSGFTDQWKALLLGTNIGGLGTPIASLASLITLKLYLRWPGAKAGRFLAVFTAANLLGLALLLAYAMI